MGLVYAGGVCVVCVVLGQQCTNPFNISLQNKYVTYSHIIALRRTEYQSPCPMASRHTRTRRGSRASSHAPSRRVFRSKGGMRPAGVPSNGTGGVHAYSQLPSVPKPRTITDVSSSFDNSTEYMEAQLSRFGTPTAAQPSYVSESSKKASPADFEQIYGQQSASELAVQFGIQKAKNITQYPADNPANAKGIEHEVWVDDKYVVKRKLSGTQNAHVDPSFATSSEIIENLERSGLVTPSYRIPGDGNFTVSPIITPLFTSTDTEAIRALVATKIGSAQMPEQIDPAFAKAFAKVHFMPLLMADELAQRDYYAMDLHLGNIGFPKEDGASAQILDADGIKHIDIGDGDGNPMYKKAVNVDHSSVTLLAEKTAWNAMLEPFVEKATDYVEQMKDVQSTEDKRLRTFVSHYIVNDSINGPLRNFLVSLGVVQPLHLHVWGGLNYLRFTKTYAQASTEAQAAVDALLIHLYGGSYFTGDAAKPLPSLTRTEIETFAVSNVGFLEHMRQQMSDATFYTNILYVCNYGSLFVGGIIGVGALALAFKPDLVQSKNGKGGARPTSPTRRRRAARINTARRRHRRRRRRPSVPNQTHAFF